MMCQCDFTIYRLLSSPKRPFLPVSLRLPTIFNFYRRRGALENAQQLEFLHPSIAPTPHTQNAPSSTPPPSRVCSAPWEYVLGAGIGAYVGNKIPQWEAAMVVDINEMRADRNMPPATRVGGYEFGTSISDSKSD